MIAFKVSTALRGMLVQCYDTCIAMPANSYVTATVDVSGLLENEREGDFPV